MAASQSQQMNAAQQNAAIRSVISTTAVKMTQQIFSTTVTPASQNVLNIAPRNVGLLLGFFVEVTAAVANTAGATATLTPLGPSNVLSNIAFYDLNNNVRINTAGWHVNAVNTARGGSAFLSASTLTGYPIDYTNNFTNIIQSPASLAASATGTVNMMYYIPLAYSDVDLRGSIYGNVVNATMNLQLTINPNPFVASGDSTLAMFSGNAGSITSATVTVYQVYYDQLPTSQNGVLLPVLDLSTIYELKNTNITGITANQDFPIAYSNFRDFLSTTMIYDNGGTLNNGSDLNYLALQAANYTNIFKVAPKYVKAWERQRINNDFPSGMYYIDHRQKPISTVQYGNMELIVNASTVNTNAVCLMGYEDFALQNVISGAQSLAPA